MSLFTPVWGAATPRASGTVEVVLQPFPPTAPATDLVGMVTQISTGGGTAIPRDGAVLVARGSGASRLAAEAAIGENMLVEARPPSELGGRRRCDRRRAGDRP